MNNLRWTRKRLAAIGLLILLVIAGTGWAVWALRSVDYLASGSQKKTFEIDCSFDRFRQIALQADRLVLRQQADIQPDEFHVVTRSKEPAGNLEDYETTLMARPDGEKTRVDLLVAMKVHVRLPRAFTHRADVGVQQAADLAIAEQATSLTTFVDQLARELLILPELK